MENREAIDVLRSNWPPSNCTMLIEALTLSIKSLESTELVQQTNNNASKQCLCVNCKHPVCGAKKPLGEFVPFVWRCDNFI